MDFLWLRASLSIVVLAAACLHPAFGEISEEDRNFFESKIRPALITHCYECHSEEAGKRKGGLWLDRREGWQLGGDSGPAAVPGDVEASLLVETVRYANPDLEMPPEGKLPPEVIADFEEWVQRGLPDPRTEEGIEREADGMSVEEGRDFWSFRPREKDFGTRDSIDDFIDRRLEEAGVEPAPTTDPLRRLRRTKLDLTGLVPTIDEQESILEDPSEGNWRTLIDGWLDSRAFGERWGRHWLDIARYADSSGGGRAMPLPEAWRFRDEVIASFAEDKPLDRLVVEHIAGDLLPYESEAQRIRQLVSTGFLLLGPHNYENQNKAELDFEIIDEQLDTLGRAFLGQTVGCARCHDHKFDPIPTRDYYAMAGIFLSTHSVNHANVSRWNTQPIPAGPEAAAAVERFEIEKAALEEEVDGIKQELSELGAGVGEGARSVSPGSLPGVVVDDTDAEFVGEWEHSTSTPRWVGAGYRHDRNSGKGAKSVRFEAVLPEGGLYELRISYSSGPNRSTAVPFEVRTGSKTQFFEVNQRLQPEHDRLFQTLGRFRVPAGESTVVIARNDDGADGHVIVDAIQWLPLEGGERGGEAGSGDRTAEEVETIRELRKRLAASEKALKNLNKDAPSVPRAMAVVDRPTEEIGGTELRIRGMESNRGDVVPRGFLEVATWESTDIPEDHSGRLELAEWITHPDHPLTARVLANRIWLHLLGEGLVRTPDNFGVTGEAPTHPDLLDFLANRLIENGWSTKALVREIVLSEVYRRSTGNGRARGAEIDPENKLYSRAHLRPVTAEALRDAMLTVSGELDEDAGGPSLPKGFRSEFGYEFKTMRRSVYVPVFRNSGYEMFSVFDFANPNFAVGKRARSTLPTQALFLTNSPFVHARSEAAAEALLESAAADDGERVELAFRRSLGRSPTESEAGLALQFLRESGDTGEFDDPAAWAALQRALFGSMDFRFLR